MRHLLLGTTKLKTWLEFPQGDQGEQDPAHCTGARVDKRFLIYS